MEGVFIGDIAMPTYSNTGNTTYETDDGSLIPGAQGFQSTTLLDALDGVVRTSDDPYFNPLQAVNTLTSTGPADPKVIVRQAGTKEIEIINNSSAIATVYYNDNTNVPGFVVPSGTIRVLTGIHTFVDQLTIEFSAAVNAGEFYVSELEG